MYIMLCARASWDDVFQHLLAKLILLIIIIIVVMILPLGPLVRWIIGPLVRCSVAGCPG